MKISVMHMTLSSCHKNARHTNFPHFVSEKFAMTVSVEDRALVVKLSHKNNDCTVAALKKFGILKAIEKALLH